MTCSNTLYTVSGVFHGITILIALICSYIVVNNISKNKPSGHLIPIIFIIILLFRLPNQICVAFDDSHGWFSVATTIVSILTFIGVTIIIFYKKNLNIVNHISNKHPTLYAGTAPSSSKHRTKPYTRYVPIKNTNNNTSNCNQTEESCSNTDSNINDDSDSDSDSSLNVDLSIEFDTDSDSDSDTDSDTEYIV